MADVDPLNQLLLHAEAQACVSAETSQGLCLHASLELARKGETLGLCERLQFVRWRVRGDRTFREHWAIALDQSQVLDLTSAQVDGSVRPLRALESYPSNYTARRFYPLPVVLDAMKAVVYQGGTRYPRAAIWRVQRSLAAFDMRQALSYGSAPAALASTGRLVEASYVLGIDFLLEAALRRLGRLLLKLG